MKLQVFFPRNIQEGFLSTLQFVAWELKPQPIRPRIPIMKSRKTRPKFAISATDSWLCTNSSPRLGPTSTPPRRYPKINGCLGSCQRNQGIWGGKHSKNKIEVTARWCYKNPTLVLPMNENYSNYIYIDLPPQHTQIPCSKLTWQRKILVFTSKFTRKKYGIFPRLSQFTGRVSLPVGLVEQIPKWHPYCWWQPEILRSPVEGNVVYPIIYRVLWTSQVVGDGISSSIIQWLPFHFGGTHQVAWRVPQKRRPIHKSWGKRQCSAAKARFLLLK